MEVRAQELQQSTSPEVLGIFRSGQFWQKSGDFTLLFDWSVEMLLVEQPWSHTCGVLNRPKVQLVALFAHDGVMQGT